MLQAENIRSARCSRVVLSKLLAARKANFLSLLVLAKKSQCSHARECLQRPFVTPLIVGHIRFRSHNVVFLYLKLPTDKFVKYTVYCIMKSVYSLSINFYERLLSDALFLYQDF